MLHYLCIATNYSAKQSPHHNLINSILCQTPFSPTETSTIILDEDIVILNTVGGCQPIVAGPGFNTATDVVFFTSTTNHSVIIQESGEWIVALNLTFNGNAQLEMQTGSILALQNNPIVRMSGNSLFKPVSVTS